MTDPGGTGHDRCKDLLELHEGKAEDVAKEVGVKLCIVPS